jgi:Lysylphosphatidylglycerol synthase TM region
MTLRRSFLWAASAALTVFLIVLLIKISKLDLRVTVQQLRSVSWFSFTKLVLLNGLLVYLSTEKWRSIDAAWRHSTDSVPSWTKSYALTSAGLALGILLPVQLAMSTARTMGTHVHGRSLKRGTAGTLFEQSFDMLTVGFLAVASGITRFYKGGGLMWTVSAAAATAIAFLVVGPSIRLIRWRSTSRSVTTEAPHNRLEAVLRAFFELRRSGLLDAGLARRLVILSALRFCVVVLMSVQTAEAINVHIPIWQMAAAVPFVVMASVIALTPGGLGVNELTSVTALKIFGTPLTVGAQWALANRALIAVSYFFVATCAVALLAAQRLVTPGATDPFQDKKEEAAVEHRRPL